MSSTTLQLDSVPAISTPVTKVNTVRGYGRQRESAEWMAQAPLAMWHVFARWDLEVAGLAGRLSRLLGESNLGRYSCHGYLVKAMAGAARPGQTVTGRQPKRLQTHVLCSGSRVQNSSRLEHWATRWRGVAVSMLAEPRHGARVSMHKTAHCDDDAGQKVRPWTDSWRR